MNAGSAVPRESGFAPFASISLSGVVFLSWDFWDDLVTIGEADGALDAALDGALDLARLPRLRV